MLRIGRREVAACRLSRSRKNFDFPLNVNMSLGRSIKVLGALKQMPLVGLGTWQSPGECCIVLRSCVERQLTNDGLLVGEVQRAVEVALKAGYRHIDCAAVYGNEQEVGEGIAAAKVPREDIWVTSKVSSVVSRRGKRRFES